MQFGRLLTLTVGNQSQAIQIVYDERIGEKPTINATIKKTNKKEPNTANISIDNLSENIRNRISSKEFNLVKLDVGWYGEELRTIFVGSIDKHDHIREAESATTTTVLECGDGSIQYSESYSKKTLQKGMTDNQIVQEIIKDMPEITKGAMEFPKDRVLPRGKTLMGSSRDELTRIADRNGCDWSIQDGQLVFVPKNKVLPDSYGYLLSQDSGMVGSPQKQGDDGLSVRTFLNTSIYVNSLVRVKSMINDYNGDYKVTDIEFKLSTVGQDWHQLNGLVGGNFQVIEKS